VRYILSRLYPQYPVHVFKTRCPEIIVMRAKIAGNNGPRSAGPDHFRRKSSFSCIMDRFPVSSIAILGDFNKSGFDLAE
jgi:hypothetical protein